MNWLLVFIRRRSRLVVAVLLALVGSWVYAAGFGPVWAKDLSLALVMTMTAAIAVDLLLGEDILDRITTHLQGITLASNAALCGVSNMFLRRSNQQGRRVGVEELTLAIKAQLDKNVGTIKVFGVAAPCLFSGQMPAREEWKRLPGTRCRLQAIYLDPDSLWAKARHVLEFPHQTLIDIRETSTYLDFLQGQCRKPNQVKKLATDLLPGFFLVITDQKAFAETYPLHEKKAQLGGDIPLLEFSVGTRPYDEWRKTFEFIWKNHYTQAQLQEMVDQKPASFFG